jgi:hypothetical protein
LRSQQESSTVIYSDHERTPKVKTATAYLEALNPEQRRAVEHGAADGLAAPDRLRHRRDDEDSGAIAWSGHDRRVPR